MVWKFLVEHSPKGLGQSNLEILKLDSPLINEITVIWKCDLQPSKLNCNLFSLQGSSIDYCYLTHTGTHTYTDICMYIYRESERDRERGREREVNQVVSSKHIFLSFKPLNHQLIKGPNKQKTNLLFLRFDILSLSKILFFHIEFAIP